MRASTLRAGVIIALASNIHAKSTAQTPTGTLHVMNHCPYALYFYEQHITVPDWSSSDYVYRKGDLFFAEAIAPNGGQYDHDFFVDNGGMKISFSHLPGRPFFYDTGIQQFTYSVKSDNGERLQWMMSDAKGGEKFNESSYLEPVGYVVNGTQCPQIVCEQGPGCKGYSKRKEDEVFLDNEKYGETLKEAKWYQCERGTDLWLHYCV